MPQPVRFDWALLQGQDFAEVVQWINGDDGEPYDLNGYTARMEVRNGYGGTLLATLTTENGGLVITAADGRVEMIIGNAVTAAFPLKKLVYDLYLINAAGQRDAFIFGEIDVRQSVTQFT